MLVPPSTYVNITRATEIDDYGDEVDDNTTPVALGVPATIGTTRVTGQDPATATPRQVSALTAVVPAGTGVQTSDRLIDLRTGAIYNVVTVNPATAYGYSPDIVLTLEAAGG